MTPPACKLRIDATQHKLASSARLPAHCFSFSTPSVFTTSSKIRFLCQAAMAHCGPKTEMHPASSHRAYPCLVISLPPSITSRHFLTKVPFVMFAYTTALIYFVFVAVVSIELHTAALESTFPCLEMAASLGSGALRTCDTTNHTNSSNGIMPGCFLVQAEIISCLIFDHFDDYAVMNVSRETCGAQSKKLDMIEKKSRPGESQL